MKAAHELTVDGARTQAQEIVATARAQADQHKADSRREAVTAAQAKAEAAAGEIAAREARLAELAVEIEKKQATLNELNAALAALRAKL